MDVTREADLIEEVGRHWGFDRIPATFPALREMPRPMSAAVAADRRLRGILCGAGLQETCTFIERAAAEPFTASAADLVTIANPLSEKFAVLRPSLLAGLVDALVYNRRREAEGIRLFETGAVFLPGGESRRVGWILAGARHEHWSDRPAPADFFDARGVATLIGEALGVEIHAAATTAAPWFRPGRAAVLTIRTAGDVRPVGFAGEILPAIVEARGLAQGTGVVGGEIDLGALRGDGANPAVRISPLPRFPSIVRDLSIVVSDRLPAADVRGTIRSNAPATLESVREFDRYQGKGVPDGMISLSLRLTFRGTDRTLTDAEVQDAVVAIVSALETTHGAVLRGKS